MIKNKFHFKVQDITFPLWLPANIKLTAENCLKILRQHEEIDLEKNVNERKIFFSHIERLTTDSRMKPVWLKLYSKNEQDLPLFFRRLLELHIDWKNHNLLPKPLAFKEANQELEKLLNKLIEILLKDHYNEFLYNLGLDSLLKRVAFVSNDSMQEDFIIQHLLNSPSKNRAGLEFKDHDFPTLVQLIEVFLEYIRTDINHKYQSYKNEFNTRKHSDKNSAKRFYSKKISLMLMDFFGKPDDQLAATLLEYIVIFRRRV